MGDVANFAEFLTGFFAIFTQKTFRRVDYLTYLNLPEKSRGNDEAPIVDTAIVSPLLGLLGFAPGERFYNQQRKNGRPDFAPAEPVYGTCFIVEDKNTSLDLTLNLNEPDSHLSQLEGYIRAAALRLGWLTNGRRLMVWDFTNTPRCIIELDIPAMVRKWLNGQSLSPAYEKALHDLFDLCHKSSFADTQRIEREIGTDLDEWLAQALPLGTGKGNESVLVEELQMLVMELQRDARRILDHHLTRYAEYAERIYRLTDNDPEPAAQKLREGRKKFLTILLEDYQKIWGLDSDEMNAIENVLVRLEQDANAFFGPKDVLAAVLQPINEARRRKYVDKPNAARPMSTIDDFTPLRNALHLYTEMAFDYHKRQATLNHDYQTDRNINDDYHIWATLVKETMLGDLSEEQRREEFALQAAYVVFIRLLLIRVCEDKGIFPGRFISDGGLKHWQEDIKRYWIFAQGNPYDPLLDMAYANAQNIYAHFFTGRELFNWYRLDRQHFIMALHRLSRFNFAGVDSDIIGTIYNTYVNRKEKREKGQYYTPPEIVNYILDEVGYRDKAMIGSQKRLIDPACGSGSFLVTAVRRFVEAYKGKNGQVDDPVAVLERVQQNIFGFDLNPFACYLAEVNLLIQTLDLIKMAHDAGKRPNIKRFHIYNVDALARPTGRYYYTHFNILLAEESDIVEQIKSRRPDTPYVQGFAYVVANPPYGASLSDEYKNTLRNEWADVFYGQPDTYTFFLKLGLELLAPNGRLGFITPNTYLMGKNTAALRGQLLAKGRIEQIVDLPQGIWPDANVDCALLFLVAENDEEKRRQQQVQIHLLGLRDTLDKLVARTWVESLAQQQSRWIDDPQHKFDIRYDDLLQRIEDACKVPVNGNGNSVLRLNDVTESTQGIIPYETQEEANINLYIKPYRNIPPGEVEWKPLLDGSAFIGRYELRWGKSHPYLKYGSWLCRPRENKFFDSSKLLVQDMRNRALKRRLVATYDDQKFYNRHNFSNIIIKNPAYDLKYILALFNSSLLNYWFARQFDNVHINPSYFRQLPIYPADATTQATFVSLVDAILDKHAQLNKLREQGYVIKQQRDGQAIIEVPYTNLLQELQAANRNYPVITLYDALSLDMFTIPERCDLQASISSNIFIPEKYPTTLVLRHNKLWLEVPDEQARRYLLHYLADPRWQGRTWDEIKNNALIPEDHEALQALFTLEAQKRQRILTLLEEIKRIDQEIDERVLDLYGITHPADRQRVLGSAPLEEEQNGGEE
ncbi:MAG TPA: N-6 DNA methylase [Ktedonobacteraceae bacterium]|nr:N-6 DNA methylase [Ktedonobacteraceae bacterium]